MIEAATLINDHFFINRVAAGIDSLAAGIMDSAARVSRVRQMDARQAIYNDRWSLSSFGAQLIDSLRSYSMRFERVPLLTTP